MDIIKSYHEFSTAVVKAMNDAGVRPVKDGEEVCCAVLVVVHPVSPDKGNPIGGSLNWKDDHWEAAIQIEEPKRV